MGVGGDPIRPLRCNVGCTPFQELVRRDHHFFVDALEHYALAAIQRSEYLVAPGVDEGSDVGVGGSALRCDGFEAGDRGDGPAVDFTPSLHRGETDANPREGARACCYSVQVDVS